MTVADDRQQHSPPRTSEGGVAAAEGTDQKSLWDTLVDSWLGPKPLRIPPELDSLRQEVSEGEGV